MLLFGLLAFSISLGAFPRFSFFLVSFLFLGLGYFMKKNFTLFYLAVIEIAYMIIVHVIST